MDKSKRGSSSSSTTTHQRRVGHPAQSEHRLCSPAVIIVGGVRSKCNPVYPECTRLLSLPKEAVIESLARCLQACITSNDNLLGGHKQDRANTTRFHAKDPVALSVHAYLDRLVSLTPYSLDAVVLAAVYINRITHLKNPANKVQFNTLMHNVVPKRSAISETVHAKTPTSTSTSAAAAAATSDRASLSQQRHPKDDKESSSSSIAYEPAPPLTSYTAHRLILASLAVASSFTSDAYVAPVRASKVGGIPVKEFQALKLELFIKLDFDCCVWSAELEGVCKELWQYTDGAVDAAAHEYAAPNPEVAICAGEDSAVERREGSPDKHKEEHHGRSETIHSHKGQRRTAADIGAGTPGATVAIQPPSQSKAATMQPQCPATPPLSEEGSESSYLSTSTSSLASASSATSPPFAAHGASAALHSLKKKHQQPMDQYHQQQTRQPYMQPSRYKHTFGEATFV